MATSFKREPKMMTTEPSLDEVKMKRGGKAKKMALGGGLPNRQITGALPPALAAEMAKQGSGRASMMQPRAIARPASGMPVMRKKGGEVESNRMEAKEEREIKGIKKELKSHEGMKAGKAHKGLKRGGSVEHDVPGGLLGGIEASKAHGKGRTGDIEGPGYKHGGKLHKAKGGSVAAEANTKVVGAKQRKSISSNTGDLEGVGYKHGGALKKYASGGSVAKYENTLLHGGPKMPTKKPGTGEIKQSPAGYKDGGHIRMHESASKYSFGHDKIDHHPMKKGGKVKC